MRFDGGPLLLFWFGLFWLWIRAGKGLRKKKKKREDKAYPAHRQAVRAKKRGRKADRTEQRERGERGRERQ